MSYSRLFILLEGNDDERFFEKVLKNEFEKNYDNVKIWQHSQKKDEKIENFIRSIKSMNADYIFINDINNAPCVPQKKEIIRSKYSNIDNDRILIVIKEIESWYLAGISERNFDRFKIETYNESNNLNKEDFKRLIPNNFNSRIDFMIEILKDYEVETAKNKNKSFKYFYKKYIENIS